jgi:hypothetical protein
VRAGRESVSRRIRRRSATDVPAQTPCSSGSASRRDQVGLTDHTAGAPTLDMDRHCEAFIAQPSPVSAGGWSWDRIPAVRASLTSARSRRCGVGRFRTRRGWVVVDSCEGHLSDQLVGVKQVTNSGGENGPQPIGTDPMSVWLRRNDGSPVLTIHRVLTGRSQEI